MPQFLTQMKMALIIRWNCVRIINFVVLFFFFFGFLLNAIQKVISFNLHNCTTETIKKMRHSVEEHCKKLHKSMQLLYKRTRTQNGKRNCKKATSTKEKINNSFNVIIFRRQIFRTQHLSQMIGGASVH